MAAAAAPIVIDPVPDMINAASSLVNLLHTTAEHMNSPLAQLLALSSPTTDAEARAQIALAQRIIANPPPNISFITGQRLQSLANIPISPEGPLTSEQLDRVRRISDGVRAAAAGQPFVPPTPAPAPGIFSLFSRKPIVPPTTIPVALPPVPTTRPPVGAAQPPAQRPIVAPSSKPKSESKPKPVAEPETIPAWASTLINPVPETCTSEFITPDCLDKAARHSAYVANKHAEERATLNSGAISKYEADPIVELATTPGDLTGSKLARWIQLSDKYPDHTVKVRNPITGVVEEMPISNPYRAKRYRDMVVVAGGESSFANPAGAPPAAINTDDHNHDHPEDADMWRQNAAVLRKIAPSEMIADNKMAVGLLESLWFCGTSNNVASDPRCFPARALGELREYQATKTSQQREALAKRALEQSGWKDLKKSLGYIMKAFNMEPIEIPAVPRPEPEENAEASASALPDGIGSLIDRAMKYRTDRLEREIALLREELTQRSPIVPIVPEPLTRTSSVTPSEESIPATSVRTILSSLSGMPSIRKPPQQFGAPRDKRMLGGITSRVPLRT